MLRLITGITLLICATQLYAAEQKNDEVIFNRLFTQWTEAFNHKDLSKVCLLFSKNITADYRGVPQKNYAMICDGFKNIFGMANRSYQYQFKLHDIYHSGDLAAVRITWYLKIYENDKLLQSSQDEGIDILKKNQIGQWQIVNYLGYGVGGSSC